MTSRKSVKYIVSIIFLVAILGIVPFALAQSGADAQSFSTSITYYTPDATGGTLSINLYQQDSGTANQIQSGAIGAHAAGSVFVGNISSVSSGFVGSAVLSSDVPIVATGVQIAQSGDKKYPRPLYSGFSSTQASDTVFIATFLKNQFGSSSQLAVQNTESGTAPDVDIEFYEVGNATPKHTIANVSIPGQSMKFYDADSISELGTSFNGSIIIKGNGSKLVASAQENGISNREAYAFEGVSSGGQNVFMGTMLCSAFGGQTSFYAIQNTSLTAGTNVSIEFYNTSGTKVADKAATPVVAGGKLSVDPCAEGVPAGTSGSAKITSSATDIIAIGKKKQSGGFATAFLGATAGSKKVVAPYIRYDNDVTANQSSFIAIMNVGSANAQDIKVQYYDASGALKATHTVASAASQLAPLTKVNSNAKDAGALDANGRFGISPFGGAVEITSDQDIIVVITSQQTFDVGKLAEDYNGTPVN